MKPGDVVVGAFPGADATKVRPAVVLSTELYHQHRPDIIVGLITTHVPREVAPTDCELRDWQHAGLHQPSFFRLFPVTLLQRDVRPIGRLSDPIGLRYDRAAKRDSADAERPLIDQGSPLERVNAHSRICKRACEFRTSNWNKWLIVMPARP